MNGSSRAIRRAASSVCGAASGDASPESAIRWRSRPICTVTSAAPGSAMTARHSPAGAGSASHSTGAPLAPATAVTAGRSQSNR
ncbi:MAG: hypothetical protein DI636_10610, partial [Pelagerythrobacter marensis]